MTANNLNNLVLSYKDTKELVTANVIAKKPIMIHGKPGIGKSDMVRQIAKELGKDFIDVRLPLYESTDIKGYPTLVENKDGTKSLSFAVSSEIPFTHTHPDIQAILLLDEINGALPSTQLASYQLVLDRAIGQFTLADGVSIVAAGNRNEDGGATFEMPKPLENRMSHVELETSFDDWVNHAIASGVNVEIIGFLAKNNNRLNGFDPNSSERAFATPRSWFATSKLLNLNINASDTLIRNIVASNVGQLVAIEFMKFRKISNELPDVMDILKGKNPKISKKMTGIDIAYMIVTNSLYKLRELAIVQTPPNDTGTIILNELHTSYLDNFYGYMIENEDIFGKEFQILPVSIATQNYRMIGAKKSMPNLEKIMEIHSSFIADVVK